MVGAGGTPLTVLFTRTGVVADGVEDRLEGVWVDSASLNPLFARFDGRQICFDPGRPATVASTLVQIVSTKYVIMKSELIQKFVAI